MRCKRERFLVTLCDQRPLLFRGIQLRSDNVVMPENSGLLPSFFALALYSLFTGCEKSGLAGPQASQEERGLQPLLWWPLHLRSSFGLFPQPAERFQRCCTPARRAHPFALFAQEW